MDLLSLTGQTTCNLERNKWCSYKDIPSNQQDSLKFSKMLFAFIDDNCDIGLHNVNWQGVITPPTQADSTENASNLYYYVYYGKVP